MTGSHDLCCELKPPPLLSYPLISGFLHHWVKGKVSLLVNKLAWSLGNADYRSGKYLETLFKSFPCSVGGETTCKSVLAVPI